MAAAQHISVQDRDFLDGLRRASKELDGDGERILFAVGDQVVARAKAIVHKRSRHLESTINLRAGRNARGPYIEPGTDERYGIFVEFGTYKDTPHPFMRPALNLLSRAIRASGGTARRSSPRASAFNVRARKRVLIRRALRGGQISGAQARGLSAEVSQRFRFRVRRRRR